MNFHYVCFAISQDCNMRCPYCYRLVEDKCRHELSIEMFKICIDKLQKMGCEIINITGGEPLLNPLWEDFIKIAYDFGLEIYLSTNGLLLDLKNPVIKYIDKIIIPFDGPTEQINSLTRDKCHYAQVMSIIDTYCKGNFDFSLKINVVITKYNINYLEDIVKLLYNKRIQIKFFQYRNKGKFNRLSNENIVEDNKVVCKLIELRKEYTSDRILYDDALMDIINPKPYILVNNNANVFLSTYKSDLIIGNLVNDNVKLLNDRFREICPINTKSVIGKYSIREIW